VYFIVKSYVNLHQKHKNMENRNIIAKRAQR